MYKNKDLQRQTTRIRVARWRKKQKDQKKETEG